LNFIGLARIDPYFVNKTQCWILDHPIFEIFEKENFVLVEDEKLETKGIN